VSEKPLVQVTDGAPLFDDLQMGRPQLLFVVVLQAVNAGAAAFGVALKAVVRVVHLSQLTGRQAVMPVVGAASKATSRFPEAGIETPAVAKLQEAVPDPV